MRRLALLLLTLLTGCGGSLLGPAALLPGAAGRDQIGSPRVTVTVETDIEIKVDEDRTLTGD